MSSAGAYGAIAQAGLGAIAGALASKRKPPKYKEIESLFDAEERSFAADQIRDFYSNILKGNYSPMTAAEIHAALGPQVDMAAGDAANARKRVAERSIQAGLGPRTGITEKSMGEVDRAELGANRQSYADFLSRLGLLRPQLQMGAAAGQSQLALADMAHAANERSKQWNARAARASVPGMLEGISGGAAAGLGAGTSNFGFQGASQPITPYSFGTPDWSWQSAGASPPYSGQAGTSPSWNMRDLIQPPSETSFWDLNSLGRA